MYVKSSFHNGVHRTFQGLVNNVSCFRILQIIFAQRNFRCATVVSITQCVAVHREALANTVEGYIAAYFRSGYRSVKTEPEKNN